MEFYAPYIPQAVALTVWCACMAMVATKKIGTWSSVWIMIAGSVAMALACLLSGNVVAALTCIWVGLCAQTLALLALEHFTGDGRRCATVIAEGIQILLTMSMAAETSYSGAYACASAVRLAAVIAGFTLLSVTLHELVDSKLLCGGGIWLLVAAATVTALVMLCSPDRVVLVDLPGWGYASLTETAVACCAVALFTCSRLYLPPDDDSPFARVALPATMLAAASSMSYLGDATAGIAFAVAMALVAMAAGRRPAFVAVSLVAAIVVAVGLSTIVPNMSNAWKV